MKQEPLAESIKYLESYDYLINKKCEVEDHSQWSLDDIRILLAQSVCYHLSIITEKMMAKPSDISDK